jgi:hypothetical protein
MDSTTELVVAALKQALTHGAELSLYRAGKQPGLFTGKTGGPGEAAALALRDGLLEIVRTDAKGEWVRLSPRGVQYLAQHESPKAVLEELIAVFRANQAGLPRWVAEMQAQLNALQHRLTEFVEKHTHALAQLSLRAEGALRRVQAGPAPAGGPALAPWQLDALTYLDQRRVAGNGSCPLPELFAALRVNHVSLTIPALHDGLKHLRDRGAVAFLPHAGPLTDLAEPEFALVEGSAIAYAVTRS